MNYDKWIAHSPDGPLAAMCELILRDEAGHVALQRERIADSGSSRPGLRGVLWRIQFLLRGYAAATMLWINHAPCLIAIGGSRGEFYSQVTRQLLRFVRSLRRMARSSGAPALWAKSAATQLQPAE